MRFYIKLVTIILLAISTASAQSSVTLIQDFQPNDSYSFEIKRGKEDSRNPMTKGLFSITSATAFISKTADESRVIKFVYGESRVEGTDLHADLIQSFRNETELYNGMTISMVVDQHGKFIRLDSYDDAKKQLERAMYKLLASKGINTDDEEFKKIYEKLVTTYDTEEELMDMYFPELSMYFVVVGGHYQKGVPHEIEYETTNPFGEEPFPMKSKVTYIGIEDSQAIIKSIDSIDPEDLRRIMISTFKGFAAERGQPFNESMVPEFNIETVTTIRYDMQAQMLVSVSALRNITSSGIVQTQLTEIKIVEEAN